MNPARVIYPGFRFGKTKIEDARAWAKAGAGGFCLYGGTPEEIESFCKEIRSSSPYANILICADYEDGLGRCVEGTELLPSNMAVAASREEDLAVKKGLITARQARSLGVDWVFAPVVDLARAADNLSSSARSFGCSPELAAKMGMAFMAGLSQGGVLNSLKHFPGRGAAETDPRFPLPVINKTLDELHDYDLQPFIKLLRFADSVLVGNLLIPHLDDKEPAPVSEKIIRGLLRQRLNYKGCVLSDALRIKRPGDQKETALKALKAGADILLVPQDPYEIIELVNKLPEQDAEWKDIFIKSTATQEMLIAKNAKVEVRTPRQALFKSTFSINAAPKCLTAFGAAAEYKTGARVFYKTFEGVNFINGPFAKRLAAAGVKLLPYEGKTVDNLLLVSYAEELTARQKEEAEEALSNSKQAALVSFGSPFVHKDFLKLCKSHLAAYCVNEDFQTTTADALLGKIKAAGILPVKFI